MNLSFKVFFFRSYSKAIKINMAHQYSTTWFKSLKLTDKLSKAGLLKK